MNSPAKFLQECSYQLFVSNIPRKTSKFELIKYFSTFGEIDILSIKSKPNSNAPVIAQIDAKSKATFYRILNTKKHAIKPGCNVEVERLLKGENLKKKLNESARRKVSVFGIYGRVNEEKFREIFSVFGEVDYCYLTYYKDNRMKAHGFVAFKTEEAANKALAQGKIKVTKKNAKIKKFTKKPDGKSKRSSQGSYASGSDNYAKMGSNNSKDSLKCEEGGQPDQKIDQKRKKSDELKRKKPKTKRFQSHQNLADIKNQKNLNPRNFNDQKKQAEFQPSNKPISQAKNHHPASNQPRQNWTLQQRTDQIQVPLMKYNKSSFSQSLSFSQSNTFQAMESYFGKSNEPMISTQIERQQLYQLQLDKKLNCNLKRLYSFENYSSFLKERRNFHRMDRLQMDPQVWSYLPEFDQDKPVKCILRVSLLKDTNHFEANLKFRRGSDPSLSMR